MKPGSTQSWLCISVLAVGVSAVAAGSARIPGTDPGQGAARRANEMLLAGLRPGRDTFAAAEKRYKAKDLSDDQNSGVKQWHDGCSGRSIRLELDGKSVIQSITISSLGAQEGKCTERRPEFLDPKNWATGLGLRLGDSQDRVSEIYGEPNSSGPASKNGQDLALMHYEFDWAGSDVPQVMQVLCARETGRVVEITLAFPSL